MMQSDPDEVSNEAESQGSQALDSNNPDDAFAILERSYNKTVAQMEEDESCSKYIDEFTKLFQFLYNTREHALELQSAKINIEDELITNQDRLNVSLRVIKQDEETIDELKGEIENSHLMIDNAHAREQAAQEVIDNLRKQIAALNAEIDFKNKMAQGDLEENPQVAKHREGLEREKAKLISEVSKLTEKLANVMAYQEELEKRTSLTDLKIGEVSFKLEETTAELDKFKRLKDKLDKEIELQKKETDDKSVEITNVTKEFEGTQKLLIKYDQQLKDKTAAAAKCFKELEGWNTKCTKLQDELDTIGNSINLLKKENIRLLRLVQNKEDEKNRLNIDINQMVKDREHLDNNFKKLNSEKGDILKDRMKLRALINGMEHSLQLQKKQADSDRRTIESNIREKDIMNKNLLRQQAISRDHMKVIKIQEQLKRKLESEIDTHTIDARNHRKQISYLEKERDRLLEEELDLTKKIEDTLDDVRLKKIQIHDLRKSLAENENQFRMQQNLFDAVRADRNALQKSLLESTAENNELKKKLKIHHHQTEQFKEDIAAKEQLLIKEETFLRKITKEKENIKVELNNCYDQMRTYREEISERKDEEKRLHKVISISDKTNKDQAKTITALMNERDVLGSQLVRRNDELSLLYEKVKILQTTLHRGEAQYDQRLQDIKLLKVEIKRLRQEKALLTKSINNMNDLKQEVFHLERDITRERMKSKALEDELHNPMNIHRWRKLEGTDPDVFDLLQKTTILQKRILSQASQLIDRERQLKEAEKLYANLRQMVAKQPTPQVQDDLNKAQRVIQDNTSRLKCLVSELNMTEVQNAEYKMQLEKITEEMNELKRKLAKEKKAHQKNKEALSLSRQKSSSQAPNREDSAVKFTGGGFRMSMSVQSVP